MYTYSNEQHEYMQFRNDVSKKVCEIQDKFNKLSDNNKRRFMDDLVRMCELNGVKGLITYFNQYMSKS